MLPRLPAALALLSALASALPVRRAPTAALSSTSISAFRPYTHYASAAYCSAAATRAWTCGAACAANAGFVPVASGGDGDSTQFWYVGYDPALETVVVGHQGTDPRELLPVLTDIDLVPAPLSAALFPGVASSVLVHSGFRDAHAKSATDVLAAVQSALSQHGASQVTLVGHSLGAAIALLDAVYLPPHLPQATFKTVVYGLPRVGNQAFADYVDAHVGSLAHITNNRDPVPTLPGRFLGFHHASGEVHIDASGAWMACSGQDNTSSECSTGAVPNIFVGDVGDHDGPYDGVTMGC
ncbi:lipase family protein [Phanerochaete sordida]|uniref:Lipase family protein n=1 Tax=Phanerochaete sordida TaxID=48140 RepID=A0A9P3G9Q6_9APHY|nr:lipase family protein [Phanerochaete sordida]